MGFDNLKICSVLMPAMLIAGLGGGCSRDVPPRERMAWGADVAEPAQGSAWETVLASPDVARWHEYVDPSELPSYGRADERLAAALGSQGINGLDWPTESRPSLGQTRRIDVRDRDGRIVIFDRERRYERRSRWHDGSW